MFLQHNSSELHYMFIYISYNNCFSTQGSCKNRRKDRFCKKLADKGYCSQKHVNYMRKNCKKTCQICGKIFFCISNGKSEGILDFFSKSNDYNDIF